MVAAATPHGPVLTEEELKDLVGTTCLWVVTRDESGGLAGTSSRRS
jgi:hypothetical protein